jgi:hypothetical protein
MLSEEVKKQKVSTQLTATIEAYHCKDHATPAAGTTIITIDKAFKRDLVKFVADSFEKWNWSSKANHQKTIADWAENMKANPRRKTSILSYRVGQKKFKKFNFFCPSKFEWKDKI